jgi:beta-mannosidase
VAGADIVFSDNYFDVPARQTIKVTCPLPAGWSPEQLKSAVSVRSLYDSF